MGASRSKLSVSRASPPLSGSRSPPTASVLVKETRDGARGLAGVLAGIPPSEAAGPPRKRLRSALPEAGGDAKRAKDVGNGVVPDTRLLNDDGQFQLASAEPESLLFSCQPLGAATDMVPGPSGSAHGLQPMSPFELDGAKHKIFLSHSGAQKDFVEQLCVDLEHKGYLFPFFDEKHHSLPKGEDFAPLIIEAARMCHVAVIVLSKEFLCSKWAMIELAEFYGAQEGGKSDGGKLKLLPLFFKLSIEEVKDEGRWMPKWKEYATCDGRIDLSKWSAVVKALCKSNGLDFEKVGRKEVAYRKLVVESIFKLSPPDLLFGSSESMVGSSRMCEAMSQQFVEDTTIGARVLGIYGMVGLGKTMLAKAMHDYFYGDFLGKVCYINMGHESRAQRQKWMLKILCGFEKDVLDNIGVDVKKGLKQMEAHISRDRVFLVLDNITCDTHLLEEVQCYLRMGFHSQSKILITSSSKAILEVLLPNMKLFAPMPLLMVEEARALFWEHVVPMRAISELTSEEHNILGLCLKKCWFYSEEGGFYHPVALMALADFLSRLGRENRNNLLAWKDALEKEVNLVKDISKPSEGLFGILGLQFSTFDFGEKLLFLDRALYDSYSSWWFKSIKGWLCRLHDESPTIIERKLMDLRKSGMIIYEEGELISVPSVYKEFAKWYAMDHNVNGLKNALGVFHPVGVNLSGGSSIPIQHWSNLVRLLISPMTLANARLVGSKRMQELRNLGILELQDCPILTELNLEGLDCLRELKLVSLSKLVTITLSRTSCKDEYVGIYDSMQHMFLCDLESLDLMPDLRPCTSLYGVFLKDCHGVRNLEAVNCLTLEYLNLTATNVDHLEKVVDFKSLSHLKYLWVSIESNEGFSSRWERDRGSYSFYGSHIEVALEGGGPYTKLLKKLHLLSCGSNIMICTYFQSLGKWKMKFF